MAPAPGYRHRDSGTLYNVGSNGYNWSSAVSGSDVRYLDFYNTWVNPQGSYCRAYGFQVRCLQE